MPDIIYHYTSLETLIAILESSADSIFFKLRATHIEYLNDESEYKIALNILIEKLIEHEKSLSAEKRKGFIDFERKDLMNILKEKSWYHMPPLISSFSNSLDSLPMWNTYANNSLGVAIGINTLELRNNFDFKECIYDKHKASKSLDSIILELYDKITFGTGSFGTMLLGENSSLLDVFRELVPIVKNNVFSYEKEWRVIINKQWNFEELEYTLKNNILKPYCTYEIEKKSFREIILGPSVDYKLVSTPLFMILKKYGYEPIFENEYESNEAEKVVIKKSNCPYRNL